MLERGAGLLGIRIATIAVILFGAWLLCVTVEDVRATWRGEALLCAVALRSAHTPADTLRAHERAASVTRNCAYYFAEGNRP